MLFYCIDKTGLAGRDNGPDYFFGYSLAWQEPKPLSGQALYYSLAWQGPKSLSTEESQEDQVVTASEPSNFLSRLTQFSLAWK